MFQSFHDSKKFYWGTKWVPAELVIGGDQPFVRRLMGVLISPMAGSIYNMGVWDKVAAVWVKAGVGRTLEGEAVARRRYQETGLGLENGGWVGDPHIVVERCLVFLCILHCCMAMGRLQAAFIEARLGDLPKDNAVAVQRVLYRAHTGVWLGASASPNGEEARALFLAWEELGPLLAYAPEDDEWQLVDVLRDLLRDLYSDTPPRANLRAAVVARAYRLHCYKAGCQSNYLFYLEEYIQSRRPLADTIDWKRPLTFLLRGDTQPCAGGSWTQLSIGLLNHGARGRTPDYVWVIGMAVCGDKDMAVLLICSTVGKCGRVTLLLKHPD